MMVVILCLLAKQNCMSAPAALPPIPLLAYLRELFHCASLHSKETCILKLCLHANKIPKWVLCTRMHLGLGMSPYLHASSSVVVVSQSTNPYKVDHEFVQGGITSICMRMSCTVSGLCH